MTAREQVVRALKEVAANPEQRPDARRVAREAVAEVESLTTQLAEAKAHPDPNNIWTEAADDARVMAQGRAESLAFKVTALTTQLQAAQGTIAEMTEATDVRHGSKSERLLNVAMIGSRADTSAHDAAIRAAKAEALREAADHMLNASDSEYLSARAASIEQEGADRG